MIVRIVIAALAASVLASCGYRGDLQRPAPVLWEDRTEYDAQQKAKKDAEEKAKQQQPAPPAAPAAPKG